MEAITDAVILMAGTGSRLRAPGNAERPKPLLHLQGRPLISRTLEALTTVGIETLHVVVGYESERLLAGLTPLLPSSIRLHAIHNPHWQKQNGVSLLCAAGQVAAPFLLLMGDHLFETSLLQDFVRQADPALLNLAIDRKIEGIFDLDDAMKVQTEGDLVSAIGKDLAAYDAIDTGLFCCPNELFDYLRQARREGDCSLADGVRQMAHEGKVRAVDIGQGWWQDVDTPAMRVEAERELARREAAQTGSAVAASLGKGAA